MTEERPVRGALDGARPAARRGRRSGSDGSAAARIAGRITRGRWLPMTILVLAVAALMIGLGSWQWGRLMGRRAANAAIERQLTAPPLALTAQTLPGLDPAALTFQRVTARGRWDYANEIAIRYRSLDGQAGVQVLTPLRIAGTDEAVLIDRGWIPYQIAEPEGRRQFQTAAGDEVVIEGLVQQPQSPGNVAAAEQGRSDAWQRVDIAGIQRQVPYPLLPFWVERLPVGDESATLPRAKGLPDRGDGSHLSYALQWWAFTAILIIGYLAVANSATSRKPSRPLQPLRKRPPGT